MVAGRNIGMCKRAVRISGRPFLSVASDIAKLDEIVHQAARAIVDRQLIHLAGNGFQSFELLQTQLPLLKSGSPIHSISSFA